MDEDPTSVIMRSDIVVRRSEIHDRLETLDRSQRLQRRGFGWIFVTFPIVVVLLLLGSYSEAAGIGLLTGVTGTLLMRSSRRGERERRGLTEELREIEEGNLNAS